MKKSCKYFAIRETTSSVRLRGEPRHSDYCDMARFYVWIRYDKMIRTSSVDLWRSAWESAKYIIIIIID